MVEQTAEPAPAAPRSAAGAAGKSIAEAYVRIAGLDKTYHSERGDVEALRGIDLDIRSGEFISILGPSGCGKSTLLKCIAGLEDLTAGDVAIRGQAVVEPPLDTGIVFQRDVLLDWRSVIDNILLPIEFARSERQTGAKRRWSFCICSSSRPSPTAIPGNCRAGCASGWRSAGG